MVAEKHKAGAGADYTEQQAKRLRRRIRFAGYEEHHIFGFEANFVQYARSAGVNIPDNIRSMEYKYSEGEGDPTVGREPDDEKRKNQKRDWGVVLYRFFNSPPGFKEDGWRAVRPLGIGGTGMAVLWERDGAYRDSSLIPSKYMVIKESLPKMWEYSGGNVDENEFLVQRALTELECDNSNILKIWRYIRFPREERHRYYLEWAPHDTLLTLYGRYKRWRRYFPEPFIWHVFHQLAKAILILQKGSLPVPEVKQEPEEEEEDPQRIREKDAFAIREYIKHNSKQELVELVRARGIEISKSEAANYRMDAFAELLVDNDKTTAKAAKAEKAKEVEGKEGKDAKLNQTTAKDYPPIPYWREIVHRDMKPGNIFLGEPLKDSHFPIYPTVKLADFGHSLQTYEGDPTNPRDYHYKVTGQFDAPETQARVEGRDQIEDRLSAHTNVFQVAANILKLATFKGGNHVRNGGGISFVENQTPPYSKALFLLIAQCMKQVPAERPTPLQLFNITKYCAEECRDYVKDDPERYQVYFDGVEINDMATSFYKITQYPGLDDLVFPDPTQVLEPPVAKRFHPYESDNLEFFEEANNEFRNDSDDEEEEIIDRLTIDEHSPNHFAKRVTSNFDSDASDSDDDDDVAAEKMQRRFREGMPRRPKRRDWSKKPAVRGGSTDQVNAGRESSRLVTKGEGVGGGEHTKSENSWNVSQKDVDGPPRLSKEDGRGDSRRTEERWKNDADARLGERRERKVQQ